MINTTQLKCLTVFSIFALIGFGPISPGCLIGMYVVWRRPEWFSVLIGRLYNHPKNADFITSAQTRNTRIKSFLGLLALFVIDIIPVPVTPALAFIIILSRPMWFYMTVRRIYGLSA